MLKDIKAAGSTVGRESRYHGAMRLRECLGLLTLATICWAVVTDVKPVAGRYSPEFVQAGKAQSFGDLSMYLAPASNGAKNWNVTGRWLYQGASAQIHGTLYVSSGQVKGTLETVNDQGVKAEGQFNAHWDPAIGALVIDSITDGNGHESAILGGIPTKPVPKPKGTDFTGTYKAGPTTFYIDQYGSRISGWGTWANGRIEGSAQGDQMSFTLTRSDGWSSRYTVRKNASGGLEGQSVYITPKERAGDKETTSWDRIGD